MESNYYSHAWSLFTLLNALSDEKLPPSLWKIFECLNEAMVETDFTSASRPADWKERILMISSETVPICFQIEENEICISREANLRIYEFLESRNQLEKGLQDEH